MARAKVVRMEAPLSLVGGLPDVQIVGALPTLQLTAERPKSKWHRDNFSHAVKEATGPGIVLTRSLPLYQRGQTGTCWKACAVLTVLDDFRGTLLDFLKRKMTS